MSLEQFLHPFSMWLVVPVVGSRHEGQLPQVATFRPLGVFNRGTVRCGTEPIQGVKVKKIVVALVGLAVFAPGALAATHFLKVSPSKVAAGKTVTVSGSVAKGCRIGHKNDVATIYSRAFKGITKKSFAGIPA